MQSKGVGKFRSKEFVAAKSGWKYQWCGQDLSMGEEGLGRISQPPDVGILVAKL